MGLLKRFEQVQEWTGWSDSEWARRAGLPERTHVSTIKRRLRADGDIGVDVRVMAALAQAAGVSLDWLAAGRGVPHVEHFVDPVYAGRATAVAAARAVGVSQAAIDSVLDIDVGPTDPGPRWWLSQIEAAQARIERAG